MKKQKFLKLKEKTKKEETNDLDIPKEFKAIIDAVEKMSVLELNALVKVIETKWEVSASAVAAAGPVQGSSEEKSTLDIILESFGGSKIPVMKVVKELFSLGLKESKELVESAPVTLKEGVKIADAEEMKSKIEEAGGEVSLK